MDADFLDLVSGRVHLSDDNVLVFGVLLTELIPDGS